MLDKFSGELYDAIQKLNRYIHRSKHKAMKSKDGIQRGKMKLLALVSKNDGIIQRDLADILDMRPSSLTEILASLEKSSLVRREQDEKDRRIMHVYLTEAGKIALDEVANINSNLSDLIFNCLTIEEKETMLNLVNKVNKNLESLSNLDEADDKCGENHHKHSGHHKRCGSERCHHHHMNEKSLL